MRGEEEGGVQGDKGEEKIGEKEEEENIEGGEGMCHCELDCLLRPTVFLAGHQEPLVLLCHLPLQPLNSRTLLRHLPQITSVTLCDGV